MDEHQITVKYDTKKVVKSTTDSDMLIYIDTHLVHTVALPYYCTINSILKEKRMVNFKSENSKK